MAVLAPGFVYCMPFMVDIVSMPGKERAGLQVNWRPVLFMSDYTYAK